MANFVSRSLMGKLVVIFVSVAFIAVLKLNAAWFRERQFATMTGLLMFTGNMGALLSGYASSTTWLVFSAFMIGAAFSATGLGRRVALLPSRWLRSYCRRTTNLRSSARHKYHHVRPAKAARRCSAKPRPASGHHGLVLEGD